MQPNGVACLSTSRYTPCTRYGLCLLRHMPLDGLVCRAIMAPQHRSICSPRRRGAGVRRAWPGRFCVACELIIAHQDELEALLANMFTAVNPTAIGHNYLVLGTVERTFWRSGLRKAKHLDEMLQHLADFKQYLHVEYRSAVWYPADEG